VRKLPLTLKLFLYILHEKYEKNPHPLLFTSRSDTYVRREAVEKSPPPQHSSHKSDCHSRPIYRQTSIVDNPPPPPTPEALRGMDGNCRVMYLTGNWMPNASRATLRHVVPLPLSIHLPYLRHGGWLSAGQTVLTQTGDWFPPVALRYIF
jgi:hypothetical protein